MKQLWAPWRLEYVRGVTNKEEEACVFCGILDQKPDPDNLVLYVSKHWGVVLNRYPYSNGHVLILPRAHISEINQLESGFLTTLGPVISTVETALKRCYNPHGMNVGVNLGRAAGAGIPDHLHFHVVPRWMGDTNFMPVLAEVRCINDHLTSMYNKIKPHLEEAFRRSHEEFKSDC